MSRRIPVSLAAAISCAALVACGSSSNSATTTTTPMTAQQYKQFLHSLARREGQAHKSFDPVLMHPTSLAQVQQALRSYANDQQQAAAQVAGITPPANAKSANEQLEKAFKDQGEAIQQVLPQIQSAGSLRAAMVVIQSAKGPQQAGQELDAALAQLRKLGYTAAS
jgi:hypothetical protein